MNLPTGVRALMQILLELGVRSGLVAKAEHKHWVARFVEVIEHCFPRLAD